MNYDVPYALIERIAPAVRARVRRTPLIRSAWLSDATGGEVWLKCENLQITNSFKVRGPFAKFAEVKGIQRVVAASAGNHGQGLAYAARAHGVACTVVVPRGIPKVKEEKIRALGAEVVKAPFDGYDDTEEFAKKSVGDATWVSPFDDPHIIAGNGGTTALEIVEELRGIERFVMPVGGGGLAVGVGVVARALCPGAKVIGVNSDASPGMWQSRRDGRAHLRIDSKETIAEGIEGGVAENTYRIGLKTIDEMALVTEAETASAVVSTLKHERMLIEGSAAVAVAALLKMKAPGKTVLILTGANIDMDRVKRLVS